MEKIKEWWNKERVGRFEKGTSQDFCPTNGGAVMYACFWSGLAMALFLGAISL